VYSGDESRRPDTGAVTDVVDSASVTDWTLTDGAAPPNESVPLERTTTTTTTETTDCFTVAGRPHTVSADHKATGCSAHEAIVRSSQISALVAAKTFRW